MEKETYRRILEASEAREGMGRVFERLRELSPIARTCVQVFRKSYTPWERRSRLLKLPELSPEELNSIRKFFSDFPWWVREPYLLSPVTGGRPRTLTSEDSDKARAIIEGLVEDGLTTTMAVQQVSAHFVVSQRTMWKIWQKAYKPTRSRKSGDKREKK